jgi:hypothetical protein
MATLLILGEDVAHGALAGELVRATLLTYAEAHLADWFSESVDALLTWRGDEELSVVRPGLRYAKSAGAGRELDGPGACSRPFMASSAPADRASPHNAARQAARSADPGLLQSPGYTSPPGLAGIHRSPLG